MGFLEVLMQSDASQTEKLKTKKDVHLARKIWHFLGVLFIVVIYHNLSRQNALFYSLLFSFISLGLDIARLNIPNVNKYVIKFMNPVMREQEKSTYAGTTWLLFGTFVIIYIFPEPIVKMSLFFLATADPIASYYGIKHGKDKIFNGKKSLQGTFAAFVCCTIIAALFYSIEGVMTERILIVSLLTGIVGAFSEAVTVGKVDDNLSFPVINSFLVFALVKLFGGF